MSRSSEKPVVEKRGESTISKHPAFGQVSISRTHGRHILYGSDLEHQYAVRLSVHRSSEDRHLSTCWRHQEEELIEIAMSEAQFASLVASMGMGSGVPCTINRFDGISMPAIDHDKEIETFKKEMSEAASAVLPHLRDLRQRLATETIGLTKKNAAALLCDVDMAIRKVSDKMPFVQQCFEEHMENTVAAAKIEVETHAAMVTQRRDLTIETSQDHSENTKLIK